MPTQGSNLPEFRSVQLDFAAHIRNPEVNPRPADVEPRRMQIYLDLFFNNVRNFIDSAFPVSREIVGEQMWHQLAREFLHRHAAASPYFLQISEEFLTFLHDRGLQGLPPFLLELCHYEWIELGLDVADDEVPADLEPWMELDQDAVLNPVMRALVYEYPVHEIGPQWQPRSAPEAPTFLIAFRDAQMSVRFIESNPVTHRLLQLLERATPIQALQAMHDELQAGGRDVGWDVLQQQGRDILTRLQASGVIAGTSVKRIVDS